MKVDAWWNFTILNDQGIPVYEVEDVLVEAEYRWDRTFGSISVERTGDMTFKFEVSGEKREGGGRWPSSYHLAPSWLVEKMKPVAEKDSSLADTLDSYALEQAYENE